MCQTHCLKVFEIYLCWNTVIPRSVIIPLIICIHLFILEPQCCITLTCDWSSNVCSILGGEKKQFQPVKSSLCVPRPEKDITHYSPAPSHTHTHTRYDECVTCSFVSHCRSGSGRRARRPGVRPSLSAPRVARTASGWSAGKHTRSPTSAPPSSSQSPATTREKKQAMSRKKRELSPIFSQEMIHCYLSFSQNDKISALKDCGTEGKGIYLICLLIHVFL